MGRSAGGTVLVVDRSGEATMVVVADAVLLAGFGSASLPFTDAVLVMVPAVAGAVALMVIVALAPEARLPTEQVTVPEALVQVPWLEDAETKVTPLGGASVTVTPVAGGGGLVVGTVREARGVPTVAENGKGMVDDRREEGPIGGAGAAR